jgi:hypothetical protein
LWPTSSIVATLGSSGGPAETAVLATASHGAIAQRLATARSQVKLWDGKVSLASGDE